MADTLPLIISLEGEYLTSWEEDIFKNFAPFGCMLFSRNCKDDHKIKNLTTAIKELSPATKIFIDEEGGRVTRLPYHQYKKPECAAYFGNIYLKEPQKALEQAQSQAASIATRLRALNIDVNCAPVVDLRIVGSHLVIGDRSYGKDVSMVTALGEATIKGFTAGGIEAVIKHIPGHGKAMVDSHEALPVVEDDIATITKEAKPFAELANKVSFAMTAHILYPTIDPKEPATCSVKVIEFIRNQLGFSGCLIADAIEMEALKGDIPTRAKKALAAGVDAVIYARADHKTEMKHLLEAVANG